MTTKQVKDLRVGDLVMGTDGKPHRVTNICNWTHGTRFISLDGKPDGWIRLTDEVETVER